MRRKDSTRAMKTLSLRKVILIVGVFCLLITALRLTWYSAFNSSQQLISSNGQVDLSQFDFSSNKTVLLDGQWRFFPNQLIDPTIPFEQQGEYQLQTGDETWDIGQGTPFGYASYSLRIQVPEKQRETLAFYVSEITSAARIYVNGEQVYESGVVAEEKSNYVADERPDIIQFDSSSLDFVEIMIHVANFENPQRGGMVAPLRFGSAEGVASHVSISIGLTILAVTVYFIHAVYAIILYTMVKKTNRDIRWLYLSLILLLITLATLLTERVFLMMGILSLEWNQRLLSAGVLLGALCLVELLKAQRPKYKTSIFYILYQLNIAAFLLVSLVSPISTVLQFQGYMALFSILPFLHATSIFYRYVRNVNKDTIYLLLAMCASFISFGWLLVIERLNLDRMTYPIDLLIALFCVVIYFYRQYFKVLQDKELLTEELRRTNQAKDKFLMMIAHELHNPIQVIRNITSKLVARKDENVDPTLAFDIQQIDAVGNRVWTMVEDMLELERIADRQLILQKTSVSLRAIANSLQDVNRYMVDDTQLTIRVEIPSDFPKVTADEKRLTQILSNLINNAIAYTEKGVISIRAKQFHSFAQISVHDTGKVILPQEMSNLFEPSSWGSIQSGQEKEGLGLNLYIAKGLVELHGGALQVSSDEQRGTTFSFILPISEEEDSETQNSTSSSPAFQSHYENREGRIRLLVIDDRTPNLRLLKSYFDPVHYEVLMAGSSYDALALMDDYRMDLLVINSALADLSGYELTKKIRENYTISELPVLLVTAYSNEEINRAGFEVGVNDTIMSPIDPIELVSRVHSLVGMKKAIEERLAMEAAWLHAQIKPHFLINTFLSIAALGRIDSNRMDALINELSTYIRLSIDFQNERGESSLERELTLVRAYLAIQKERFGERIQVRWEIDETVCVSLPPLTLQSIVENAISHGILQKEKGGIVTVKIKRTDSGTCFIVQDTGVGIPREKIDELFTRKLGFEARRGVGLLNTNRRLKQRYNRGLEIESTVGLGTVVRFKIPN